MKLTKEMFDFEKYEYFDGLKSEMEKGAEWLDYSGHWVPLTRPVTCLCRKPKPPPRYILLNEGEKLQFGDELLVDWSWTPISAQAVRMVVPGEVWRRKDTTK